MTQKALLIIDVQETFRAHPTWETISNPHIAQEIQTLDTHERAQGTHIIWVLRTDPGSNTGFDETQGYVRPIQPLIAQPEELTITKTSHNAFTTTSLAQYLTHHHIATLQITGIRTEQCVETTTRIASDMGYKVELIIDATATHPLTVPGTSRTLTPQEIIDRTATTLSGRFATISTLATVIKQ